MVFSISIYRTKELEERNQNMVREIELANNELACLRDECKEHRFEKATLKEEMGAVNTVCMSTHFWQ